MANNLSIPEDYYDFLRELKGRILQAQVRAVISVNRELVLLYWQIGRDFKPTTAARMGSKNYRQFSC